MVCGSDEREKLLAARDVDRQERDLIGDAILVDARLLKRESEPTTMMRSERAGSDRARRDKEGDGRRFARGTRALSSHSVGALPSCALANCLAHVVSAVHFASELSCHECDMKASQLPSSSL